MELNDLTQVVVHIAAVSDHAGHVNFTTDRGSGTGIAFRHATILAKRPPAVDGVRLDEVLAGSSPSLAELDIEGAEPLAFLGSEGVPAATVAAGVISELQDRYLTRYDWTAARLAARMA